MVRGASKGPGLKKTRVSKKKKQHVLRHTVNHMRGGGDYPQSHQRVRKIDPTIAGAGILGSRLKDRPHQGHTVPRARQTLSNTSATSYNFTLNKERKDAGTQFKPVHVSIGSQVRNEGPRFPNMGAERPYYNPNPARQEAMPDRPDRMQLDGVHRPKKKGMGPKKMEIERGGRVKKEVAKIDAQGPSNELVGAEQVLHRAPPRAAPRPAPFADAPRPPPARAEPPAFNRNNFANAENDGRRQRNRQRQEERRERREGFRNPGGEARRPQRAERREASAAEEAAHDNANIEMTNRNNRATGDMRRELAERNRQRKAAREAAKAEAAAARRGGVPSGSANIPANQHESGPSGHGHEHHHHTGHRNMHDPHFRTGM